MDPAGDENTASTKHAPLRFSRADSYWGKKNGTSAPSWPAFYRGNKPREENELAQGHTVSQ